MTTSGPSDTVAIQRSLRASAGRIARELPWVANRDPWAILVSEVMLQQTQARRVIEPWRRFLVELPTVVACADAPRSVVIGLWGGLGYNRRAGYLHDAARLVVRDFDGRIPREPVVLRTLPGIGAYTANAVASFAFGVRVGVLDTNVGRVLARAIANRPLGRVEAQRLADQLVPRRDSAKHNQSMLDLGAQFCTSTPQCIACPLANQCAWRRDGGADPARHSAGVSQSQSVFEGSDRQLRGRIVSMLRSGPRRLEDLHREYVEEEGRIERLLSTLVVDGLVERGDGVVQLVDDPRDWVG